MIPFVIVFGITIFLVAIASSKRVSKKLSLIIFALAAIILSLFGGLRSYDVGTDLGVYGMSYYEKAEHVNSYTKYAFDKNVNTQKIEDHGYLLINYIVAHTIHSPSGVLILLQLLTNLPIFLIIYKHRERLSPVLAIAIYLSIYYCRTLNMLRQAVALSFALLTSDLFFSKKYKKALISAIVAYLFHSTVIYALLLFGIIYIINKSRNIRSQKTLRRTLYIIAILMTIALPEILNILHGTQLLSDRLFSYIRRFTNSKPIIPIIDLIINTIILIPLFFNRKVQTRAEAEEKTYRTSVIFGYIIYYSKIFISYTDRFALYFAYPSIILVPSIMQKYTPRREKTKLLYTVLILVSLAAYWYIKHVVQGAHEVVPYRSIL